jgi:ATP-dependent Zn protease
VKTFARTGLFPLIVIVMLVYLASQTLFGDDETKTVTYAEVEKLLRNRPELVDEVRFRQSESEVIVRLENGSRLKAHYPGAMPSTGPGWDSVTQTGGDGNSGPSAWWSLLTSLLPFVLLFGFWVFLMDRTKQRRSNETLIPDAKDFRSDAANQ